MRAFHAGVLPWRAACYAAACNAASAKRATGAPNAFRLRQHGERGATRSAQLTCGAKEGPRRPSSGSSGPVKERTGGTTAALKAPEPPRVRSSAKSPREGKSAMLSSRVIWVSAYVRRRRGPRRRARAEMGRVRPRR